MATISTDTCASKYTFIYEEYAKLMCQVLEINLQRRIKSKQI